MIDPAQHVVAEHVEPDEDLAWIEHQIYRAENDIDPVSEDAAVQRRDHLARLRRIRREMLRDGR